MLVGTFKYGEHKYNIKAYDFEDNISVYLSSVLNESKRFIDRGIIIKDEVGETYIHPSWEELYLSIGSGNVKVDCYTEIDGGLVYKNDINRQVIARLSEILRSMKSNCTRSNRLDLDELYSDKFNPSKVITYSFGEKGYMSLEMLTIVKVHYICEGVELDLSEDGSYDEKIYKHTDTTHKFKIFLDEFNSSEAIDDSWDFEEDSTIFSLQEIIERNPEKSYVWLRERKYHVVKDIRDVEKICKKIWNHDGLVSFDTETTGLNVNITSRVGVGDRLVGLVFSIEPGEAWYFPIAHKKIKNICSPEEEHYVIDKYFKPILEKKDLLCFNGAYDWKVMYNYNICLNLVHDLYIMFKVTMWNDNRGMKLSLKKLTGRFLNRDSFELSDFVRGRFDSKNVKFWDLEEESVKYYACPDTDNLIELFEWAISNNLLEKYGAKKTYQVEVAFSIVIAYQEYYGHCVDIDKIEDLVNDIQRNKEQSYAKMVEIVGHDFNPKSTVDLQKVLFDELNYPIIERTDKGNPSTGKDSRKKWASEKDSSGNSKYPMAELLQIYADNSTLESNFTKNIDKFATDDGIMFSQVQQFLETGRVSVKEPNYQSYSDVVKHYIIPRTGYYALDADYSSVEARIMVSMAGCRGMVEKLKDPDADYHTLKASDMFGVPYELVSHKLRKMSKGVNFGILYGLGDWNLGVNLYGVGSPENARRAKKQKELYYTGMEELRGFIDKSKHQGTSQFYSDTFFGRRRYYDPRKERKDRIERQSCNARIQGTAADIYKIAMVRLFSQIRKKDLMGKVLISAFVHDECFLEIHKSLDPCKVLRMLRKCMMLEINGWCPLFIGCGFGRNWYEAKNTELPVQVQDKFINTWGTSGLDWWNGDSTRLYEWQVNEINNYRRDRVLDYLNNKDNWGKVFNPVENSLAHEVMEEIKSGIRVDGALDVDFEICSDMVDNLREFCKVFNCLDLFEKADIQRPDTKQNNTQVSMEEEDEFEEESQLDIIKMRVNTLGVHYIRGSQTKVYFKWDESKPMLMRKIHDLVVNNIGDSEVVAVKEDGFYTTGMSMNIGVYPKLLQLCLSYAKI